MPMLDPIRVTNAYAYLTPNSIGIPMHYSTLSLSFRASKEGHSAVGLESAKAASTRFGQLAYVFFLKPILHRSRLDRWVCLRRKCDIKVIMVEMGTPRPALSVEAARATRESRTEGGWNQIVRSCKFVEGEMVVSRDWSNWRSLQLKQGESHFAQFV